MKRKFIFSILLFFFTLSACANNESTILARPQSWDAIKHVVIIVFENTKASDALKQPFFKKLTTQGAYLNHYFAITHPSQPNYIAMIGGSTFGVLSDRNVNINATHLGNLLDNNKLTWKAYAENYPGNCFLGSSSGDYVRKHVPFLSFMNVQSDSVQCDKIVAGTQFFTDLAANQLPTYSFYVPNLRNNGHDTNVAFADKWLANTFGPTLSKPTILKNTLFIITFDEDDLSAGNNIYTVFVGAAVKPGVNSNVLYNHYSMLSTIENIFKIGHLHRYDEIATVIDDIWMS
jgi:hypothetical protein